MAAEASPRRVEDQGRGDVPADPAEQGGGQVGEQESGGLSATRTLSRARISEIPRLIRILLSGSLCVLASLRENRSL